MSCLEMHKMHQDEIYEEKKTLQNPNTSQKFVDVADIFHRYHTEQINCNGLLPVPACAV
jgi:hypothetical protein